MAVIPTDRIIDWSVAGVEGGIPVRATISQTVSTSLGNDSAAAQSGIQTAINNTASGQVCYIPPGIYRVTGDLTCIGNITCRGAGTAVISSSSNSIGSGTKVFTVSAGLGYSAGVQVLVRRNSGGISYDDTTWMQGSVTSYSGTTLTLNITSSADGFGSGVYARWDVSLTIIKFITGGGFKLGADGSAHGYYSISAASTSITSGNTKGSSSIDVASTAGISVGNYVTITGLNDGTIVHNVTENGTAAYVDNWGNDSPNYAQGTRNRGQIVKVLAIFGSTLTIDPPLYTSYATPWLSKWTGGGGPQFSGIEDLTYYAASSTDNANFYMNGAANCWLKNVRSEFTGGDHVNLYWCIHCEIRHCYFKEAFVHTSGGRDNSLSLLGKSSANLVIDSIFERLHVPLIIEWGSAGNVIAYNYTTGEYDDIETAGNRSIQMGLNGNHGAHPQYNLFEGNISNKLVLDAFWGTSSHTVALRNWFIGHAQSHSPYSTRTGQPGAAYELNQGRVAVDINEGQSSVSLIGNILGDSTTTGATRIVTNPTTKNYDNTRYYIALGYITPAGSGTSTTLLPNPSATLIEHGNYYYGYGQVFDSGIPDTTMPVSWFLASKPGFFGNLTWPPFNPTAPGTTPAREQIPAGYRYSNGTDPASGSGTPTLLSAVINGAGTTITLNFSENVSTGGGGAGGFTLSSTGGAVTMSYVSGAGTPAYTYSLSRTISYSEIIQLTYTQPGNGLEATSGGVDLASFSSGSVGNGSIIGAVFAVTTNPYRFYYSYLGSF